MEVRRDRVREEGVREELILMCVCLWCVCTVLDNSVFLSFEMRVYYSDVFELVLPTNHRFPIQVDIKLYYHMISTQRECLYVLQCCCVGWRDGVRSK